jgi:hypothetical protein
LDGIEKHLKRLENMHENKREGWLYRTFSPEDWVINNIVGSTHRRHQTNMDAMSLQVLTVAALRSAFPLRTTSSVGNLSTPKSKSSDQCKSKSKTNNLPTPQHRGHRLGMAYNDSWRMDWSSETNEKSLRKTAGSSSTPNETTHVRRIRSMQIVSYCY